MSPPSSSTIERSEKYHSCYQLQHYRQVKGFIHVITINFNNISDMYHSVNPNSDNHIFYMSSNIRHVCLVDFRSADATREGTPTRLGKAALRRPSHYACQVQYNLENLRHGSRLKLINISTKIQWCFKAKYSNLLSSFKPFFTHLDTLSEKIIIAEKKVFCP